MSPVLTRTQMRAISCGMSTLLAELEDFVAATGLSEHRAGIIVANNGRLIPRLRDGGRIWPDTETKVREAIVRELASRTKDIEDDVASPATGNAA